MLEIRVVVSSFASTKDRPIHTKCATGPRFAVKFLNAAARQPQSPILLARERGIAVDDEKLPEAEFWRLIDDPVLEARGEWYKSAANAAPREFAFETREFYSTREDAYEGQPVA